MFQHAIILPFTVLLIVTGSLGQKIGIALGDSRPASPAVNAERAQYPAHALWARLAAIWRTTDVLLLKKPTLLGCSNNTQRTHKPGLRHISSGIHFFAFL